jgi:hypothetical protein
MGLFFERWKSKNESRALKAVERLIKTLYKILSKTLAIRFMCGRLRSKNWRTKWYSLR